MGFHLPHIFAFLILTLVVSHAALPPQVLYWNSVLPNTKMPKAISELLEPDSFVDEKSTSVVVGKAKVHAYFNNYKKAASETQLHADPNVVIFFFEKDMRPGTTMNLRFTKTETMETFLPRKAAESIPFSSKKIPEIFDEFSVKPGSPEADMMKETLEDCESSSMKGEDKYCATSLESMIDFSTSKLGGNVRAVSSEVEKGGAVEKYAIMPGVKKLGGGKSVVCHKQYYAYAVFYCHASKSTRAYVVPLKDANGVSAKAVAICHTDTSEWNPKHLAFQVLKVKPGTVPICHFLPNNNVLWVSNQ